MISMTLAEIATAVNGRLNDHADPQARVTGSVEHDSRKVGPGGLFIAINGERVDGHDFASQAIAAGATALLATSPVDVAAVMVDDVLVALGRLARTIVDRLDGLTVIGLTGSSGKTSTKDIVAHVCRTMGATVATAGNFNNELGHPYTVCQADESTRYLVLEMGARGAGDLTHLCEVAPVDIAVVLNVGMAHLDGFGSIEATAKAKSELPAALSPHGTAILNADDARVSAMAEVTQGTVINFGTTSRAQVRANAIVNDHGRPRFELQTPTGSAQVAMRMYGAHYVSNALAAAGVGHAIGMNAEDIAASLSSATRQSVRRMDVFVTDDDLTVIDDSYNANPASMNAALSALGEIAQDGRKIAVLGYMAEIQASEYEAHRDVGRHAADQNVDTVIVVEQVAAAIAEGARERGATAHVVDTQEEAISLLDSLRRSGDTILVKGSRYRTWKVADHLRRQVTVLKEADA